MGLHSLFLSACKRKYRTSGKRGGGRQSYALYWLFSDCCSPVWLVWRFPTICQTWRRLRPQRSRFGMHKWRASCPLPSRPASQSFPCLSLEIVSSGAGSASSGWGCGKWDRGRVRSGLSWTFPKCSGRRRNGSCNRLASAIFPWCGRAQNRCHKKHSLNFSFEPAFLELLPALFPWVCYHRPFLIL